MYPQSAERQASNLSSLLRQSLHDALSEVSDTSINAIGSPGMGGPYGSPAAKSASASYTATSHFPGFFPSAFSPSASLSSAQLSPSAMLGVSSSDLFLAAAAEKRMFEQQLFRQRALEQNFQKRRQNESLLGLFHRGNMGQAGAPCIQQGLTNFTKKQQEQPKDPLKQLGSSLRNKASPYVDVSTASDPDPCDATVKRTRGGVKEPFPEKLHRLLEEIEDDGNGDCISFYSHGRAFGIHDTDKFVNEIMPKYFKQSRLSSFQRQLNLYGFKRITSGPDAGGYYHELFLRGRPNMCLHMRRVGLPKGEDRRKMRSKNVQVDPDFYSMKPVAAIMSH